MLKAYSDIIDMEGVAEWFTLGFTLDGKTMLKDILCPVFTFPDVQPQKNISVDDTFEALDCAVEKAIKPHMALALSGGMDSRIIAGLVANHDKNVVTWTFGHSEIEKKIAAKVSSDLGLNHITCNDKMFLNEQNIEETKLFLQSIGGMLDIFNGRQQFVTDNFLKALGFKHTINGGLFEIVNGGWSFRHLTTTEELCNKLIENSDSNLPQEYRDIAYRNLCKACQGMALRNAILHVFASNGVRTSTHILPESQPLADKRFLECLLSLPIQYTREKRLQRIILRRFMPNLNRIPYAMSLLPPSLPLVVHMGVQKMVTKLHKRLALKIPNPLTTSDVAYYFRNNIDIIRKKLLKTMPPLFKHNYVPANDYRLLLKIVTYNALGD